MKKVVYIHQYFKTPEEGGAIRSFYISRAMHEAGYQVEIITAHNESEYELKLVHGLKIHYLPVAYDNRFGFIKRILAFVKFVFLAKERLKRIKNPDVCYITSTPLTVGIVGLWATKKLGLPYIFEVRDLWPEAPIQMGVLKNKPFRYIARKLEAKIYKHAIKIIALSPGINKDIKSRFPQLEVVEIPNMADCNFYMPTIKKDDELKYRYNANNKFVISYFGAIGRVNQLEYLLQAADLFQKLDLEVTFLIAGDGAQRKKLMQLVRKNKLKNVTFLGYLNRQGIKELLSITDAAYVSFASYPVLETNSPNKFFDALAAGKLIITNTKGWLRELVETHNCGFYYNPHLPEELMNKVLDMLNNPSQQFQYQKNARRLAENHFNKDELIKRLINSLFPEDASSEPLKEKAYISNH